MVAPIIVDDDEGFREALRCAHQNLLPVGRPPSRQSTAPKLLRSLSPQRTHGTHSEPVAVVRGLEEPLVATDTEDAEPALTLLEVVYNLVNTVVGVGVISVPFAFRLSGYSCALLLLIVIFVTSQTAKMIGASLVLVGKTSEAKQVPPEARDFAFLAKVAFGPRTSWFIGAVTGLELWLALITFMIMNGVNSAVVWPVNQRLVVVCSCLVAWVMSFLPMKVFSYVSLVSTISLLVAGLAMAMACWALGPTSWAEPFDHDGLAAILQFQHIPQSVGIIVFCFAGHACFPVFHENMEERRSWGRSVDIAFFVAVVYYGGFGVLGYRVFGESLKASFTENIASVPGASLWRSLAAIAFLVKVQLTAPLLFNGTLVCARPPRVGKPWWSERLLPSAALIALTTLVALAFADDVAAMASFTGSACCMITSVLFPAIVHLRLTSLEERRSRTSWATHALVIAFGLFMGVSGTVLSLHSFGRSKPKV